MADHFVSYARADTARITKLVQALQGEGYTVFWDLDVLPGEEWADVLERELLSAKAVIVAWTDESRASRWVREEANLAFKHRKLIPLTLDESGPPFGFTSIQAADFIGWDGDRSAECWQRLTLMLDGVVRERRRLEESGEIPAAEPLPRQRPSSPESDHSPRAMFDGVAGERRRPGKAVESPASAPVGATTPGTLHNAAASALTQPRRPLALPWLALLVAGATLAGLAIADVFQNSLLAASIILAASLYALFQAADVQMQPAFKALAERWLIPVKGGLKINVAEAFHTMFQAVFWHRHWSWQCAGRSALASTIAFTVIFAFGWVFVEPFRTAMVEEWGTTLRNLIIFFLIANLLADYLSLFQTRLFIRFLARHGWAAPIVVIVDFIATLAILAIILYGVNALGQWLTFAMGGVGTGAEEALVDGVGGEGAKGSGRGAPEERAFRWPSFLGFYQGLIPQFSNPQAGIADLWARTWVLLVASATTYITSVWLLFITVFGSLLRLLVGRDGKPALIGRLIGAERRPFTALGAASAVWVMLLAAPIYGLAATGAFDGLVRPRPVTDPVLDPALVEESDWASAQDTDTIDAYRRYLDAHPDGPSAATARARIAALEEAGAWARAQSEDTVAAYEAYLGRYADGPNAPAARSRIAEIEAQIAQANEQAAWEEARRTDTIGAYQRYLEAHGDSANAGAARARIAALTDRNAFAQARRADTIDAYRTYLAEHPDGAEAEAARARIAALEAAAQKPQFEPGSVFRDPLSSGGEGPEMVVIPAGSFTMGSPPDEEGSHDDEGPQRRVTIAQPFAMGRHEVTWAQWEVCVAGGGCRSGVSDEGWGKGRRPVINVSWNDAQAYISWLNSQVASDPYRLPSEAEWEYAARAGTTTRYWTGDTITTAQANFRGDTSLQQTVPVGSYGANPFGLYDVHGNVREWVQDCWHSRYSGAPTDGSAWMETQEGDCSRAVVRGGSWYNDPRNLRAANRDSRLRDYGYFSVGFRVARTLPR